jgi:hypothetical protein
MSRNSYLRLPKLSDNNRQYDDCQYYRAKIQKILREPGDVAAIAYQLQQLLLGVCGSRFSSPELDRQLEHDIALIIKHYCKTETEAKLFYVCVMG